MNECPSAGMHYGHLRLIARPQGNRDHNEAAFNAPNHGHSDKCNNRPELIPYIAAIMTEERCLRMRLTILS